MFRTLDDVRACWTREADATLKLLAAVPDGALGQAVTEDHRDLRRMAWHLVESLLEMPARFGITLPDHGLVAGGFIGEPPQSVGEICAVYARNSEALLEALAHWTDEDLVLSDDMYGETWLRGLSLWILVVHQTHHRGQMTVLMRQAGLPVPSIYGPTKEGWSAYGMDAPKV